MSYIDLATGYWRFHQVLGERLETDPLPPAQANGTNTDVLLKFTPQDLQISVSEPQALHGTWYQGTIIPSSDPSFALYDTEAHLGHFWAHVFPALDQNQAWYSVQLIQEGFEYAQGNESHIFFGSRPNTTAPLSVRVFTGRYIFNDARYFGYAADNVASEIWTCTLTYEASPQPHG